MQTLAIPADSFHLLIPVSLVAQIVGTQKVNPAAAKIPAQEGYIRWREFDIPLLRSAELITGASGIDSDYQRIIVLWPMKSATKRSFIALTSMGPPRVIDIVSQSAPENAPNFKYTLGYVELEDGLGVIPDVERIANTLYVGAP